MAQAKKDFVVVCAIGLDQPAIIARISGEIARMRGNIMDISQTIMQNLFALIMTVDITGAEIDFRTFKENLERLGDEMGSKIVVQHQDTFRYMHRV